MARLEYLDFCIDIGNGAGGTYPIKITSPFEDASAGQFRLPYDDVGLERVLRDVERAVLFGSGKRRSLLPAHVAEVKDFGEKMFSAVLGAAEGAYDDARRRAREGGKGLRLRLTTEADQLAAIPWEFLYDPKRRDFVSLSSSTPVVRYLQGGDTITKLEVAAPLRILGMVSNPQGLDPLDVASEQGRIERALGGLIEEGTVELHWTAGGTWRDLQAAMRRGPWHVFHYIGHGGFDPNRRVSVLAFEAEPPSPTYHAITPQQLARLVRDESALRLVILNACEGARGDDQDALSSTAAFLVQQAAPAVLAMQWEISDAAAVEFSRTFYDALADGMAVDGAVAEARVAVSMASRDSLEWATPVLFMRSTDGVLFDLTGAAESTDEPAAPAERHERADHELPALGAMREAEELYRGARFLAAAEQWDKVLDRFADIDALGVELEDVDDLRQRATDAVEAERTRSAIAKQLETAKAAMASGDWGRATEAVQAILALESDHSEARHIGTEAEARAGIAALYASARRDAERQRWGEVLKRFEEMDAVGVDVVDDPDDLRGQALVELAEAERRRGLEARYDEAMAFVDGAKWAQALPLLEAIATEEPGYRGVEQLRDRVRGEAQREIDVARREVDQATAEQLYVQALRSAENDDWTAVAVALDQIDELLPDFGDPEGLGRRAAAAIERASTEETHAHTGGIAPLVGPSSPPPHRADGPSERTSKAEYRHTQTSYRVAWMSGAWFGGFGFLVGLASGDIGTALVAGAVLFAAIAGPALLFGGHRLTTWVDGHGLRVRFGWAGAKRKVKLADITAFRRTQLSKWKRWWGYKGLRWVRAFPRWEMVVLIETASGKPALVGTDDAEGLLEALERCTGIERSAPDQP